MHGPVRLYDPNQRIPLLVLRNEDNPENGHGQDDEGSIMLWFEPNLKANFNAKRKSQ